MGIVASLRPGSPSPTDSSQRIGEREVSTQRAGAKGLSLGKLQGILHPR